MYTYPWCPGQAVEQCLHKKKKKQIALFRFSFSLFFLLLVIEWGTLHKLPMQAMLHTVSLSHQQMDWAEEAPKSGTKAQYKPYLRQTNLWEMSWKQKFTVK